MQARRDPLDFLYGEVFRLPPGTTDPDHYLLLGVPWFTSRPERVRRAATERLALLDACEAAEREGINEACATLREKILEAQAVLLDPARRRAYEERLIGRAAAPGPGREASAPPPRSPPRSPPQPQSQPPSPSQPQPPPPRNPRALSLRGESGFDPGAMFAGRYRILGTARDGALGTVVEALDGRLRRRVHLSVLGGGLGADLRARRYAERAIRAAARLDHPRILRVEEAGEAGEAGEEDGRLFLRMEPPDGPSLAELLPRAPGGRLPPLEAQRFAHDVLAAVAAAHAEGVAHGALDATCAFFTPDGGAQVADFAVARAVAELRGRERAAPGERAFAEDRDALGRLLFLAATGGLPDPAATSARLADSLPEDCPAALRRVLLALLHPVAARRPRRLEPLARALARGGPLRTRPRRIALAALVLVALAGGLLAWWSAPGDGAASPVATGAWRTITAGRPADALEALRPALARHPDDPALRAAAAAALEALARDARRAGDPWGALASLREARELDPRGAHAGELASAEAEARTRLEAVAVALPAVAREVVVHIEPDGVPLRAVTVAGTAVEPGAGPLRVPVEAGEGAHAIDWTLVDAAGHERSGTLHVAVDRTAPALAFVSPAAGRLFGEAAVPVRVRVSDAHPPGRIAIGGVEVPLRDGEASTTLEPGEGEHLVEAVAVDAAGNRARATLPVVVDTAEPRLELARDRIVTADGVVAIEGRVVARGATLRLDGERVAPGDGGRFALERRVTESRTLRLVARGANGKETRRTVEVVVDREPPRVRARWDRRARDGTLLHGRRAIERGTLGVALEVEDATAVRFETADGRVDGGFWLVPARDGRRTVALAAIDEAGHRTTLELAIEGRAEPPALSVTCPIDGITNAREVALHVAGSAPLHLGDERIEPGRRVVLLREGRRTLVVRAVDRWGNETRWTRTLEVDRTPPALELEGPADRAIGRQELVFRANEPLASLTCAGETVEPDDDVARVVVDLVAGRRHVRAVARDLAGNEAEVRFPVRVENRVLELDGTGAVVVEVPDTESALTLECWVRGEAPVTRMVVAGRGADSGYALVWSSVDVSLPFASYVSTGRGYLALPARRAWRWGGWTHLALCWDGERVRFFVDGSLQAIEDCTTPPVSAGRPLVVGGEPGAEGGVRSRFVGAIDDLRLSRVARYRASFRPPRYHERDADTLVLLRFDVRAADGTRHPDSSRHGRDARPVGGGGLREESR